MYGLKTDWIDLYQMHHVDRGYDDLVDRLQSLGATIARL